MKTYEFSINFNFILKKSYFFYIKIKYEKNIFFDIMLCLISEKY